MISFNKPYITEKEEENIKDCLSRRNINGDGYYTKKVTEFIEKTFKTKEALMTTSGS